MGISAIGRRLLPSSLSCCVGKACSHRPSASLASLGWRSAPADYRAFHGASLVGCHPLLNHLASVDQIASNLCLQRPGSVGFFGSGLTSIHFSLAHLAINWMYHVHFLNQGGRCWFRMNLGLVLNEAVEAEQEQRCPIFIIKSKRMKSTSMKHLIMKKSW